MSFKKEDATYRSIGGSWSRRLVIEVDGVDDYVEVGNHSVFNFTNGGGVDKPFSMSCWIQIETASDQGAIISKNGGGGVPSNWFFGQQSGQLQAIIYDGSGSNSRAIRAFSNSGLLTPGQWDHVLMTYDGSNSQNGINIYSNGVLRFVTRSNPQPYTGLQPTSSPVRIGANAAGGVGNEFEKYMAEAVIYDYEVTAAQASELYNNGRPLDMNTFSGSSGIVSWWRLGNGDSEGFGGMIDGVGGYNGTLENGAKIVVSRDL